jgi:hypothetical protein
MNERERLHKKVENYKKIGVKNSSFFQTEKRFPDSGKVVGVL